MIRSHLSEWDKLPPEMKIDLLRNQVDQLNRRLDRTNSMNESFHERIRKLERLLEDKA